MPRARRRHGPRKMERADGTSIHDYMQARQCRHFRSDLALRLHGDVVCRECFAHLAIDKEALRPKRVPADEQCKHDNDNDDSPNVHFNSPFNFLGLREAAQIREEA